MEDPVPVQRPNAEGLSPLTPAVFHILLALSEGELHGYAIMRSVEEVTTPTMKMGPGTIYGSLQRMEDAGLVEDRGAAEDGRRRLYGITELGRTALEAESARLARLSDLVREKGLVPREV
jgi:DNA-binding PadR family transcriptional regulator